MQSADADKKYLAIVNNLCMLRDKKCFVLFLPIQESEAEIEEEVDILMSSDIVAAQMSTKSITFVRAQSGWFFRENRTVT